MQLKKIHATNQNGEHYKFKSLEDTVLWFYGFYSTLFLASVAQTLFALQRYRSSLDTLHVSVTLFDPILAHLSSPRWTNFMIHLKGFV